MDNNNFKTVPQPRYINEYRKFKDIFSLKRNGEMNTIDKLLVQIFVSLVIIALLLLMKNINNQFSNTVLSGVKSAMEWEVDFTKGYEQIRSVFSGALVKEEVVVFIMPIDGEITSGFGERVHPVFKTITMHSGIDIAADYGALIKASCSGRVEEVGEDSSYGKYIRIINGQYTTLYAHCSAIEVVKGQKINQGDIIGQVGDSGIVSAPHLHFEIWENGTPINPIEKINK